MANDNKSLSHTKWNCKYHIVFAPEQRDLTQTKNLNKEIAVVGGEPLLSTNAELRQTSLFEHSHGNFADNRKIFGSMTRIDQAGILMEGCIQHPMQTILNCPMPADKVCKYQRGPF